MLFRSISLSLAVIVGIFVISWSTEKIWNQFHVSSDSELIELTNISKLIPHIYNQHSDLEAISSIIKLPVSIITRDNFQFGEEQLLKLNKLDPLITYYDDDSFSILLLTLDKKHLLLIGPISTDEDDGLKTIIHIASYLMLGLIIALWTRPLWRDLYKLQLTVRDYGNGEFEKEIDVSKRSTIYPLSQTLKAMAKQISRLIDEQKQLTNAVSHDLRTPLSRLKFSLAMLPEKTEQVKEMKQDVIELEQLVDSILSYGRLENQQQSIERTTVNISDLLKNLTEKLSRDGKNKIKLTNIPDLCICICDGHLIERALQNLLTNAMRYGRDKVEISLEVGNELLNIHVDDDGEGINSDDRKTIFKAFHRLEKSRNKTKGGFGLGLAIVERIANWHGGTCKVSSSPIHRGARFTLSIPIDKK